MFRTRVISKKSAFTINHQDSILALGSCFAERIGENFKDYKFNVNTSPFGTIFNPISIFKLIDKAALKLTLGSEEIVASHGMFHHLDLHSDLSDANKKSLLRNANNVLLKLGSQLPQTSIIIYTFGTSVVHEWKETGKVVANCHKIPAIKFTKRMLEIDEIVAGFEVNFNHLKKINKDVKVILTVSPVRHHKESFEQNNVSKSILRLACEQIVNRHEDVEYFPAFEIMMDDLRDYRFYNKDMLHPSPTAVDYIWQKFQGVFFSDDQRQFILKWDKIRKSISHIPFNRESAQHQLFIKHTISLLNEFRQEVDVTPELNQLKAQLI